MEISEILGIVVFFVTLLCGFIAKKFPWFNNNLIPIQNLLIGIISSVVAFIITKDFSMMVALSGIAAGGTYDIIHNVSKIKIPSSSNGGDTLE